MGVHTLKVTTEVRDAANPQFGFGGSVWYEGLDDEGLQHVLGHVSRHSKHGRQPAGDGSLRITLTTELDGQASTTVTEHVRHSELHALQHGLADSAHELVKMAEDHAKKHGKK